MTLNVVALLPHILIDYCLLGFLTNTHTHIFLWGKYLNYIFESCLQKSPKRHTFDSIRGMKKKNGVAKWNFFPSHRCSRFVTEYKKIHKKSKTSKQEWERHYVNGKVGKENYK